MAKFIDQFKVGQEVVAMAFPGTPCQCNGFKDGDPAQRNPHPCRVTIVKIGKTKVYAMMSGRKNPVAMTTMDNPNGKGLIAVEINQAKRQYRASMEQRGGKSEWVDKCVEGL